jgi:small subunit ribosomal protein S6
VAIVRADLNEDEITALIERIQTIITERKGVISQVDRWGKRHLAYEIKKQKDGYYFLIDFAGDGSVVNEIERNYKIDDRVLKFMTVKKEGATTAEGIAQEAAAAEAKRTQAKMESNAGDNAEAKAVNAIEKAPREARLYIKKNNDTEETSTKGE